MTNFYKELKPTLIIVGIICILTVFLQFYYSGKLEIENLGKAILFNIYYGGPLSLVNGYFFEFLNKKVPWDHQPRKRATLGVVGSIGVTMATLIFLNLILWVYIWGYDFSILWNFENRNFYIIALVITIIVSTTIHAIGFFKEVQSEKLISQKLRQEKLATELSALRSHVDPHFLFNSFNVLSGLIDEDPDKAQEFLAGLSKIYRYILEQRNEDTSTVRAELDFAEKYIDLQQMRFENSITVETVISKKTMTKKIPSLSLQLLLENAVKHNGFSDENPLRISIAEEGESLVVKNNMQHKKSLTSTSGMGLQNINDRYSLLTKKEIMIDSNDKLFTVKLPLI